MKLKSICFLAVILGFVGVAHAVNNDAGAYLGSLATTSVGTLSDPTTAGRINASTVTATNTISIGTTTNPNSSQLYFYGGSGSETLSMQNSTTGTGPNDGFNIQMGNSNVSLLNGENGHLIFGANASAGMYLSNNNTLGIGNLIAVNKLDVGGAAVIGATYAGTNTAPANGLLIQGQVGIATTTVNAQFDVTGSASVAPFRTSTGTLNSQFVVSISTDGKLVQKNSAGGGCSACGPDGSNVWGCVARPCPN